jgi:hypothetical protein
MSLRAYAAIVEVRLRAQRRPITYASAAAVLAGIAQPPSTLAAVFTTCLFGILFALVQSPGRYPHLDVCEQSAPLFGRELARARALVPCVAATLTTLLYCAAQLFKGAPVSALTFVAVEGAVIATTLTALSATIRLGAARALYVLGACAVSAGAYVLTFLLNAFLAELAFCAIVAFFALRQYGETLARFDPL